MPLTVTYKNEAFPDDKEFGIRGLGILTNGVPIEVDEALERNFISENRQTIDEALGSDEAFTVDGTTAVAGGVKEVLGIELSEISDTPVFVTNEATTTTTEDVAPVNIEATSTPVEPNPLLTLRNDDNPDS